MSKLITIVIFCFSLCLLGVGIALHSVFQDYNEVNYPQKFHSQDVAIVEGQKYLKLQTLANYPIVGNYFSEPYIKEIWRQKNWQQVIKESSKALDSIINVRSYRIWFYKAFAECAMHKFQQCQKSLYQSQFLAPKTYMSKINKLKRIFMYKYVSGLEQRIELITQI